MLRYLTWCQRLHSPDAGGGQFLIKYNGETNHFERKRMRNMIDDAANASQTQIPHRKWLSWTSMLRRHSERQIVIQPPKFWIEMNRWIIRADELVHFTSEMVDDRWFVVAETMAGATYGSITESQAYTSEKEAKAAITQFLGCFDTSTDNNASTAPDAGGGQFLIKFNAETNHFERKRIWKDQV